MDTVEEEGKEYLDEVVEKKEKREERKLAREKIVRTKPLKPILRVANDTPPKRLSKTIMGCLMDWGKCRITAVGERPSWQAYKALVLAKKELAAIGIYIYIDPSFMDPRPVIEGEEKTGADISVIMTSTRIGDGSPE